jgi:poly(A) polymerase
MVVMTAIPARLDPLLAPDSPAQRVAAVLTDAGYECYLVGGSVRDALIGRERANGPENDFATNARPDTIEKLLRPISKNVVLVGARFGTVCATVDGVQCEVTTFRSDVYHPESRKPEVVFGDDIETDLSRRDFSVNAMALRLPHPLLVAPFDGAVDLAERRLRTPQSPDISFTDDPLRMLRAARFIAGFGLEPVPELIDAVGEHRGRLEIVSAERIRDELSKLLVVDDPAAGLWFVARTGLADEFFPELNAMQLEQDPIHHHKDVLAHTIAVVQKVSPDIVLRLAALLHDIGKPKTRSFEQGRASFHHHEVVGARMARERMLALRYPNDLVDDVAKLVELHLRFHTYRMGWTDSAVRRYVRDAGPLLDDLNELTRCDCTTRDARKAAALGRRMDELVARIAELREHEELARIRPALDGKQVMKFLGVAPGPVVGEALAFLLELRLEEGPIDEEESYERLAEWARERGLETGTI